MGMPTDIKDSKADRVTRTICQLVLSLGGDGVEGLYEVCGNSDEFAATLTALAEKFDSAWDQMTPDEHEEANHDYIGEVDKLAVWIKDHLEDVAKNDLEYPFYPCGKIEWAVVKTVYDTSDGKILYSDRTVLDGFDNGARGCLRDAYRRFVANDVASYITDVPYVQIQNLCFTNDFGGRGIPSTRMTATMYDNPGYKRTPNRIEWELEKRVNGKEVKW